MPLPPMSSPSGLIASAVPGRTDRLPMRVKSGSYVIPADVVSGIGQGNTLAGAKIFDAMFKSGPYGTAMPKMPRGRGAPSAPPAFHANGGEAEGEGDSFADIITAGGEVVIDPDTVAGIGGGDMSKGHDLLDNMVKSVRKQVIAQMQKLPGPVK